MSAAVDLAGFEVLAETGEISGAWNIGASALLLAVGATDSFFDSTASTDLRVRFEATFFVLGFSATSDLGAPLGRFATRRFFAISLMR